MMGMKMILIFVGLKIIQGYDLVFHFFSTKPMLTHEKSFIPGGLIQWLFFKKNTGLWMEQHNAYSVGRNGKQPAQLCQLLPVHQVVRYDFGVDHPQGPSKRSSGQKNIPIKRREYMLRILGKLLSYICLFCENQ